MRRSIYRTHETIYGKVRDVVKNLQTISTPELTDQQHSSVDAVDYATSSHGVPTSLTLAKGLLCLQLLLLAYGGYWDWAARKVPEGYPASIAGERQAAIGYIIAFLLVIVQVVLVIMKRKKKKHRDVQRKLLIISLISIGAIVTAITLSLSVYPSYPN